MKILRAHQIELSDEQGRVRIRLTAASRMPQIEVLDVNGNSGLTLVMDDAALSSVTLNNPKSGPHVSLAVDAKGGHVKFDGPDGASSYLFLNNEGTSGLVLIDGTGTRRYSVLVGADGKVVESKNVSENH